MSSDVYIDVQSESFSEDRDSCTPKPTYPVGSDYDCIRIGHFGTMSYYLIDLLGWFQVLSGTFPIINNGMILFASHVIRYFNDSNKKYIETTTPEWRRGIHGYEDPDWNDVIKQEELEAFFDTHCGMYWCIRVD